MRLRALLPGPGRVLPWLHAAVLVALVVLGLTRPPWGPAEPWAFTGAYALLVGLAALIDRRARSGASRGGVMGPAGTNPTLRRSTAGLRDARETMRANERLFTLGMFSAGIAHEIKNPVAAILATVQEAPGMVDDLERAIAAGDPTQPLLEELRGVAEDCGHAGLQLQRIAMDLGNMVRGGATHVRSLEAAESLQGVARMLKQAAGQDVTIRVSSNADLLVLADPGRLMQVLLNLAGNAIDALRGQGGGTLRLEAQDAGEQRVRLVVADDGPGIATEVQERMYDPFFTTKGPGQGTGLGLHLVSEIVHAQRGTIECESRVGRGTTFRVELPGVLPSEVGEGNHEGRTQDDPRRGRRGDDPQGPGAHAAA